MFFVSLLAIWLTLMGMGWSPEGVKPFMAVLLILSLIWMVKELPVPGPAMNAQLRPVEALESEGMYLSPAVVPPYPPTVVEVRQDRTVWRAERLAPGDWTVQITTQSEVGEAVDEFTIAPGDTHALRLLLAGVDMEDARAQERAQDDADERETDK